MSGAKPVSDLRAAPAAREADAALARAREIIAQLDALEPRVSAASSGEVQVTLLERATDLVDEAGRLLETLARGVS